jgi:geranylgeranyl pyrophosphate synthase
VYRIGTHIIPFFLHQSLRSHIHSQLQAYFLVADDMMDQSVTRRGQPCWFRIPKVSNIAINDAFMLEAAIYHLLKTHFRRDAFYADLLDLFHDVSHKSIVSVTAGD